MLEEILVDEGGTAALGEPIARLRGGTARPPPAGRRSSVAAPAPGRTAHARHRSRGGWRTTSASSSARSRAPGRAGGSSAPTSGGADRRAEPAAPVAAEPAEMGRGFVYDLPQTPTQRTIAQRMSESRSTIPEFTLETEIAMDAVATAREELTRSGRRPDAVVQRLRRTARPRWRCATSRRSTGATRTGDAPVRAASTSASRSPPTTH